jgi:hypothetical protein
MLNPTTWDRLEPNHLVSVVKHPAPARSMVDPTPNEPGMMDLECNDNGNFLVNQTVHDFSWQGLTVTVKDRETKQSRDLINDISGDVQQGT